METLNAFKLTVNNIHKGRAFAIRTHAENKTFDIYNSSNELKGINEAITIYL